MIRAIQWFEEAGRVVFEDPKGNPCGTNLDVVQKTLAEKRPLKEKFGDAFEDRRERMMDLTLAEAEALAAAAPPSLRL